MPLVWKKAEELGAAVAKNLFLRDKKRRLYLLSVRHDRELNLNAIGAHNIAIPYFNFLTFNLMQPMTLMNDDEIPI